MFGYFYILDAIASSTLNISCFFICILGVHNILTVKRRNLILIYRSPNAIEYTQEEDLDNKFAEQINDNNDDS